MILHCRSFAKINWTLEVLGKREDDYHEIRTLLQTIDLHDEITFEGRQGEISVHCSAPGVPEDSSNLAHRAATLLRNYRGVATGARINIEKRIPIGGGLGGGSSNAAVTLMGLDRLWRTDLKTRELLSLASQLGSDVPFFLLGGTAAGVGRGDEVYPLPDRPGPFLLIVTPPLEVSTEHAYRKLLTSSKAPSKIPGSCAAVFRDRGAPLVASDEAVANDLSQNDFEPIILNEFADVRRAFEQMASRGAPVVRLCGSGSSVVGSFSSEQDRENASEGWPPNWLVICASAVSRADYHRRLYM